MEWSEVVFCFFFSSVGAKRIFSYGLVNSSCDEEMRGNLSYHKGRKYEGIRNKIANSRIPAEDRRPNGLDRVNDQQIFCKDEFGYNSPYVVAWMVWPKGPATVYWGILVEGQCMILMQDDDVGRSIPSIHFSLSYMWVPMRSPQNMSIVSISPRFPWFWHLVDGRRSSSPSSSSFKGFTFLVLLVLHS